MNRYVVPTEKKRDTLRWITQTFVFCSPADLLWLHLSVLLMHLIVILCAQVGSEDEDEGHQERGGDPQGASH